MRYEVLRLDHIAKAHDARMVLNDISFNLFRGESMGVLVRDAGEKQCILDILLGKHTSDGGRMYVEDAECADWSEAAAEKAGIYCVDKLSELVPNMSVAKNFYLRCSRGNRHGLIYQRKMLEDARRILENAELSWISPEIRAEALSKADVHLCEMARAEAMGAKILVVDDICDMYSDRDMEKLKRLIRRQNENGLAVLYFTNKYSPLFEVFRRVTIVRMGTVTKTLEAPEIGRGKLLRYLDANCSAAFNKPAAQEDKPVFFTAENIAADKNLRGLSFSLREHEVLGIWDVEWESSNTLAGTLCGAVPYTGAYRCDGRTLRIKSMAAAIKNGIAISSSQYYTDAIYKELNLFDNVTMLMRKPVSNAFGIVNTRIQKHFVRHMLKLIHAEDLLERFGQEKDIRKMELCDQMKVVVAKWLCIYPKLFVFVNPYINFDDLTIQQFKTLVEDLQSLKIAVIILSVNRGELARVCDRVLRLEGGRIVENDA